MASKDYYGKCGSCKFCELGSGEKGWSYGTMTFKCDKSDYRKKADEEACSRYEPAMGRTNETIEKYLNQ